MSQIRKAGSFAAAILALTSSLWARADTEPVAAEQAPAAWVAYAQLVSQRFQLALASDSGPAQRFNAYFSRQADAAMAASAASSAGPLSAEAPEEMPPVLRVKAWLDRSGRVTRVEFDGVNDGQAAADLRALLTAQRIGRAPPRQMKQPLVVRLAVGAEL